MQTYDVEYSSNNSGGDWWMQDEDWQLLEAKGWKVQWQRDMDPKVRRGDANSPERFLRALATNATKQFEANSRDQAESVAQLEWEIITGYNADEQGCPCCGQPHYFWASEVEV